MRIYAVKMELCAKDIKGLFPSCTQDGWCVTVRSHDTEVCLDEELLLRALAVIETEKSRNEGRKR